MTPVSGGGYGAIVSASAVDAGDGVSAAVHAARPTHTSKAAATPARRERVA